MRILAISDLHGEFAKVQRVCRDLAPDLLLCCGDWGNPDQVAPEQLGSFLECCTVLSTFGNHDPRALLESAVNRDGGRVLLEQGRVRVYQGLRLAAIGGIWAKSHRLPHYLTDEDVIAWAKAIARDGSVDILLTHACAVGIADLTPSGRHGGQRCFLEAQKIIAPRLHLCGHLHVAQERTFRDGRRVVNIGATSEGSIARIQFDPATRELQAELGSLDQPWP